MSVITKMLRQRAVYWAPVGVDNYGKATYATPVVVRCRWEDRSEEFLTMDGDRAMSTACVYVGQDVLLKGVLYLSLLPTSATDEEHLAEIDQSDPFAQDGAWEIRKFSKMGNFKCTEFLREATL